MSHNLISRNCDAYARVSTFFSISAACADLRPGRSECSNTQAALAWKKVEYSSTQYFTRGMRKIVYYAPREEKTWTVHISCKGKHEMWAGQFYSRGASTIFRHTRAENTTFAFLSRERKWYYFRAGYGEKLLQYIVTSEHTCNIKIITIFYSKNSCV